MAYIVTAESRLSFVHLLKPYAYQPGQEESYSVTILIPKSAGTKAEIDAELERQIQRGVAEKWNGMRPAIVPNPVYDGDGVRPSDGMAFGPECRGHWVVTAKSKLDYPPEVVDAAGNSITNHAEVYSGMYGRVCISFFPYSFGGKKGIGCALGPVQKTRDGEPLGGSTPKASSVFGAPAGSAANVFGGAQPTYAVPTQAAYTAPVQTQQAMINPLTGLPM